MIKKMLQFNKCPGFITKYFKRNALENRYAINGHYKIKPTGLEYRQEKAIEIFKELINNKESVLNYNLHGNSMYIVGINNTIMFIEHFRIQINTVHTHEIIIDDKIYQYMNWLFSIKKNIEFNKVKNETITRINHTMDVVLENIKINK